MSFICIHCKSKLSSISSLNRHQKTTKKCLEIQGKINDMNNLFTCTYCTYDTRDKMAYNRHLASLKHIAISEKSKDKELLILKNELSIRKEYEAEFKRQAFKAKTITNTQTNNNNLFSQQVAYSKSVLSPFEEIREQFEDLVDKYFTEKMFLKGTNGACIVINSIMEHEGKKFLISYENRKTDFHRKLNNDIEIDDRASQFLNEIIPYISKKSQRYMRDIIDEDDSDKEKMGFRCLSNILEIGEKGSAERKKCIKTIADSQYISNRRAKSPESHILDLPDFPIIEEIEDL